MKGKICVIFTGGTIGSESDGKSVGLNTGSRKLLLDKYRERTGDETVFDVLTPINILSENVQKDDLMKLYECIRGVRYADYDGIIVTHGTDTLTFTVNWLSLTLCDLPLPLAVVSALYPLTDSRSNGVDNFIGAVEFIRQTGLKGVYCSFKNDNENCKIHLGSRLIYPDEINGFYHSAVGAHLAELTGGKIVFNSSPLVPPAKTIAAHSAKPVAPLLDERVMLITMRTLLNFATYDFERVKPSAVVVELSHSGTICTQGEELNFINFAEHCKRWNVPVIIAPVMSRAGVYESMSSLPGNVIVSYDITVEMTLVKVMAALGAHLAPDAYLTGETAFETIAYPLA